MTCAVCVDALQTGASQFEASAGKLSAMTCAVCVDALQTGASQFEASAGKLKRKYWWQNLKVTCYCLLLSLDFVVFLLNQNILQQ